MKILWVLQQATATLIKEAACWTELQCDAFHYEYFVRKCAQLIPLILTCTFGSKWQSAVKTGKQLWGKSCRRATCMRKQPDTLSATCICKQLAQSVPAWKQASCTFVQFGADSTAFTNADMPRTFGKSLSVVSRTCFTCQLTLPWLSLQSCAAAMHHNTSTACYWACVNIAYGM